MEEPPSALTALVFWRVILSTAGSIALALLLSRFIASFTAEYGITVVILGITFGSYWQGRAEAGLKINEKVEEQAHWRRGSPFLRAFGYALVPPYTASAH